VTIKIIAMYDTNARLKNGQVVRKTIDFNNRLYNCVQAHAARRGCQSFSEAVRDLIRIGLSRPVTEKEPKMNQYVDVKAAARLLGRTPRQVRTLCNRGKVPGAIKEGRGWKVPLSTNVQTQ
jgi:hypothetical protein